MSDAEDTNPCGAIHPLPCGLDEACEVPVSYFNPMLSNEKIVNDYQNDNTAEDTED